MKNIYAVKFFAICPVNCVQIEYDLVITSTQMIRVEELLNAVQKSGTAFHEDIADKLFEKFGGHQVMFAEHHGVSITTERG